MALHEICDGCNRPIGDFNVDIDFDEITNQEYENAKKNAPAVKIEYEAIEAIVKHKIVNERLIVQQPEKKDEKSKRSCICNEILEGN